MIVPTFDIFRGALDRDALWLCAVQGLAAAKVRMNQLAAETPGRYFIFFGPTHEVVGQTETSARRYEKRKGQGA